MMLVRLLSVLSVAAWAKGDFACVCNYNVEAGVYSSPDSSGAPIGYLYEFDCKPAYAKNSAPGTSSSWLAIQFERQVGYIQKDSGVEIQTCPDSPTDVDLIPTSTNFPHGTRTSTGRTDIGTQSEAITTPAPPPTTTTSTMTKTTSPSLSSQYRSTNITMFTTKIVSTTMPQTATPLFTTTAATTQKPLTLTTTITMPTSVTTVAGSTSTCPTSIKSLASSTNSVIGYYGNSCYLLHSGIKHWNDAEAWCSSHGNGHLVHIESAGEQAYLLQFLQQNYNHHSIWIGLSDQRSEGTYRWTSGDAVSYTNWAANQEMSFIHGIEDCVVMDTHSLHGTWDDRDCSFEFYGFLCEYETATQGGSGAHVVVTPPTTAQSSGDGNTNLCPSSVIYHSHLNNGIISQHDRACYEIMPDTRYSWEHAENLCQSNGGHLAHISNQQEQDYVQAFLQRHFADHAVWIGLNDVSSEGRFEWTAGTSVSYTNWIPGHASNTLGGSSYEDCTVLVPYKNGQWDDVHCGYEEIFGHDTGEIHYPLCQYKIPSSSAPLIG